MYGWSGRSEDQPVIFDPQGFLADLPVSNVTKELRRRRGSLTRSNNSTSLMTAASSSAPPTAAACHSAHPATEIWHSTPAASSSRARHGGSKMATPMTAAACQSAPSSGSKTQPGSAQLSSAQHIPAQLDSAQPTLGGDLCFPLILHCCCVGRGSVSAPRSGAFSGGSCHNTSQRSLEVAVGPSLS